jgi:hypothetical protein
MKPAWTVQPVHFWVSRFEPVHPPLSLSPPGYGTYFCGKEDKSIIVFVIEYVPRNAMMMRGTDGGWEIAM